MTCNHSAAHFFHVSIFRFWFWPESSAGWCLWEGFLIWIQDNDGSHCDNNPQDYITAVIIEMQNVWEQLYCTHCIVSSQLGPTHRCIIAACLISTKSLTWASARPTWLCAPWICSWLERTRPPRLCCGLWFTLSNTLTSNQLTDQPTKQHCCDDEWFRVWFHGKNLSRMLFKPNMSWLKKQREASIIARGDIMAKPTTGLCKSGTPSPPHKKAAPAVSKHPGWRKLSQWSRVEGLHVCLHLLLCLEFGPKRTSFLFTIRPKDVSV